MCWDEKSEGTVWTDSVSTSTSEAVEGESLCSTSGGAGARFSSADCLGPFAAVEDIEVSIACRNSRDVVGESSEGPHLLRRTTSCLRLIAALVGFGISESSRYDRRDLC
jgi:hypothetical protein